MQLDSQIPPGALDEKWDNFKAHCHLVNPSNKKKYRILIVGTGLAGASAAATLGELGYHVQSFCIQDRLGVPIVLRLKVGLMRPKIIPMMAIVCGGYFTTRLRGETIVLVRRMSIGWLRLAIKLLITVWPKGFPLRVITEDYWPIVHLGGSSLTNILCARSNGSTAPLRGLQCHDENGGAGQVEVFPRREMLDLVLIDGKARGIIVRNLVTGELERYGGDAVLLCTGGYGNVYNLSTNGRNSNVTAAWRCHKRGALFANPCFTQIHPTCIPVSGDYQSKLTLMSESLRNDGRVWVPKDPNDRRSPQSIPESDRDYYLERKYPTFGNLVPRDVASRNAKAMTDQGKGAGGAGGVLGFPRCDRGARTSCHCSTLWQPFSNVSTYYG